MAGVDFSPRRVWLGMYIPGKKLFRLDAGRLAAWIGTERARMLLECYKDAPSHALVYAALGLDLLPDQAAAFGPAMRDARRTPRPGLLYGAALTDIRDFLKFRYRAKGLDVSPSALLRMLRDGQLSDQVAPDHPDLAIKYTISALDALSHDPEFVEERESFVAAIYQLRDLLEGTAKFLNRLEVGEERWSSHIGRGWDYQFPWKPAPKERDGGK